VRDIAGVLHVSTPTVISKLKKVERLSAVNDAILEEIAPQQVSVDIVPVRLTGNTFLLEGKLDEMWSFVQNKQNQRWLWHAIDHETGKILAYVLGNHTDNMVLNRNSMHNLARFAAAFEEKDHNTHKHQANPNKIKTITVCHHVSFALNGLPNQRYGLALGNIGIA
jgi:hypothetical protein